MKANILVEICYTPPNQNEDVDELFYKKLKDISRSSALGLVGDFKLTGSAGRSTYWRRGSLRSS